MRFSNFLAAGIFLLLLFLEEEEEKREYYEHVPQNVDELKKWANDFHKRVNSPLYGIVLAGKDDFEALSFVQNHHTDLKDISGQDCCFIYFRNLKKAKDFANFLHSRDQAEWAHQIVNLVGISDRQLPGFLFGERIDSGKYVYISLKGLSQQEILDLAREMFEYVRRGKSADQLTKFKGFNYLSRYIIEIGKEVPVELVKSFADILSKSSS